VLSSRPIAVTVKGIIGISFNSVPTILYYKLYLVLMNFDL
jgi:hypothetical protein